MKLHLFGPRPVTEKITLADGGAEIAVIPQLRLVVMTVNAKIPAEALETMIGDLRNHLTKQGYYLQIVTP